MTSTEHIDPSDTMRVLDAYGVSLNDRTGRTDWTILAEGHTGARYAGTFRGWDGMDSNDDFAKALVERSARFDSEDYPVTITSRYQEVTDTFRVFLGSTDLSLRAEDISWEDVG